jgi:hypothetical protein
MGDALSDTDLTSFWTARTLEKGGHGFGVEISKGMQLKAPQINIMYRAFALLWDQHTPPLEFWSYPPTAAMFEHILREKGLSCG